MLKGQVSGALYTPCTTIMNAIVIIILTALDNISNILRKSTHVVKRNESHLGKETRFVVGETRARIWRNV